MPVSSESPEYENICNSLREYQHKKIDWSNYCSCDKDVLNENQFENFDLQLETNVINKVIEPVDENQVGFYLENDKEFDCYVQRGEQTIDLETLFTLFDEAHKGLRNLKKSKTFKKDLYAIEHVQFLEDIQTCGK